MNSKSIFVTQPSLPPLKDFITSLEKIWESKWLTNKGPFHEEFEKQLSAYLGVKYISVFSNGTLALITALQALQIKGQVITTPYTFVATTNALHWNAITPVFCDIDPVTGNLDADKIEKLITPETTAILPVHVYGNPCDLIRIQEIANKHNLKVIYDAAHAFGVRINGESILNYGDFSILSFHATKTFNTIEGGAVISHDEETKKRIDFLKNFGIADEVTVIEPGINAKMNELQAAFGLLQLKDIDNNILKRKKITELYRQELKNVRGIRFLYDLENVFHNYSYFPIYVEEEYPISRDELYESLKKNNIYTRRYFYPLISSFSPYSRLPSANAQNLKTATRMTNQVLCLPLYSEILLSEVLEITAGIKNPLLT
jgi:dTDP-4-amino-4,6-dideoxygalactose transaminase